MHKSERQANLLGAVSLAAGDQLRAAVTAVAPNAGEGPASLVAISTFLEGGSIEELSRVLGLSHSATVRLVDRLEQGGLVKRQVGDDARVRTIVATSAGRRAAERIRRARMEVLSGLLELLSPSDRAELTRLHEKLLGALAEAGAPRGRICRLCDAEACGHHRGRCPVTEA